MVILKSVEMQAGKILECCKWSLMVDSGGSSGGQKGNAHEDSEGNENFMGSWTTGHSCYILTENLVTFCSCPKILCKDEIKGGLINLMEEISGRTAFS